MYSVMGTTTSRGTAMPVDTGMELDDFAAKRIAKLVAAERAAAERAAKLVAENLAAAKRAATERAAAKVANDLVIMQNVSTTDVTNAKQRSRMFAYERVTAALQAKENAIANPACRATATVAANAKSLADAAMIFADNVEFLSTQYIYSLSFSLSLDNIADARREYVFNLGVCCRNLNTDTKSLKVRQTWGVTMRHIDNDAAAKQLVEKQGN